jgi:small-conductance mechanosensitive channel
MGAVTGEWKELLFSIPLLLVAVPYMAYVTAYLTGLWTNTLLLDSSVFVRYMVFTVLPLMFSMMLSLLMTSAFIPSVIGLAVIMIIGAAATTIISRKIRTRWHDAVLDSAGGGADHT